MIDKALFLVYNIIVVMSEDITGYMQTYRSGHNGADSKSVCGQPHVSSNLTVCAKQSAGSRLFRDSADSYLCHRRSSVVTLGDRKAQALQAAYRIRCRVRSVITL